MRILFDARSVRTPSGAYVFRGLTTAWQEDTRVERVFAAIPSTMDRSLVPKGVEPVLVDSTGWPAHVAYRLSRVADNLNADVIFSPNAAAPRDSRSVAYFQDLSHFRMTADQTRYHRAWCRRMALAGWRKMAASSWMLAIPVSREIAAEVEGYIPSPVVLIPNGVDVGRYRWTGDEDEIFVMGGTGARKNEATAIRAWARIAPSVKSGTLLDVGGVEPVDRRRSLQRLSESLGVSGSVSISGAMSRDVYLQRICSARLAISCSAVEAFGLPVAEALALGAPVLSSAIASHLELLERAGAGVSFETNCDAELGRKIEGALLGAGPARLEHPPHGWTWRSRAGQHIDEYASRI
jgi:glycosyltransferase involved in cell wall biosynthesis